MLGCGIISSVLYIAVDLLASLRWYPGYSYRDQEFSELFASGSPVRTRMILLNGIPYTLLVLAFAAGVWLVAGRRRAGRFTAGLLAGYAIVGFIGGVVTPMATREAIAAGKNTFRNDLHIPATAVMSLGILGAIGVGSTLLGRRFRWYSYTTIAVLLVFGMLTSLQAGDMAANRPTPWAGIEERVNIYATMLWIASLAVALLRPRSRQRPRPTA